MARPSALVLAFVVAAAAPRDARAQEESPEVMRALDLESASKFREAAVLFKHSLDAKPTPGALLASITQGSFDGETYDRELPARQQATLY